MHTNYGNGILAVSIFHYVLLYLVCIYINKLNNQWRNQTRLNESYYINEHSYNFVSVIHNSQSFTILVMGKFNLNSFRFLETEHFRVLTAVCRLDLYLKLLKYLN